ncbi:hypothetical protein [Streptomyces sp. KR55]|uniref:hypothetical protein n=1 Tax=Streptomyces sp. KR55 TaxID=3457425 RepID=UPI003FD07F78
MADGPASGPAETLRPDEKSLLEALCKAQTAEDWAPANGTSLRLVADTAPAGRRNSPPWPAAPRSIPSSP